MRLKGNLVRDKYWSLPFFSRSSTLVTLFLCTSFLLTPYVVLSLWVLIHLSAIHSRLNHHNIVSLMGAGLTSRGVRFIVLERLDGGTLTQMLGYDTRIRDRRRRFWRKKHLAYLEVLRCAHSLASALYYCQEDAIPGSMVLHRDLVSFGATRKTSRSMETTKKKSRQ
jgi:serine/threonine protein kinase